MACVSRARGRGRPGAPRRGHGRGRPLVRRAARGIRSRWTTASARVRNSPDQREVARSLRALLHGSGLAVSHEKWTGQDPYTLRCLPQVLGAVRLALEFAEGVALRELNAVTDNPVVFEGDEFVNGGNFHGQPLALALDTLALAIQYIAGFSERRIVRLVHPALSRGLPAFLAPEPGIELGFMVPQYLAAALVNENTTLVHPASATSLSTSADQEDFVSMGPWAGAEAPSGSSRTRAGWSRSSGSSPVRRSSSDALARGGNGSEAALRALRSRVAPWDAGPESGAGHRADRRRDRDGRTRPRGTDRRALLGASGSEADRSVVRHGRVGPVPGAAPGRKRGPVARSISSERSPARSVRRERVRGLRWTFGGAPAQSSARKAQGPVRSGGPASAAMAAVPAPDEKLSPARGFEPSGEAFPARATGAGGFSRNGGAVGGLTAGAGVEGEGPDPVGGGRTRTERSHRTTGTRPRSAPCGVAASGIGGRGSAWRSRRRRTSPGNDDRAGSSTRATGSRYSRWSYPEPYCSVHGIESSRVGRSSGIRPETRTRPRPKERGRMGNSVSPRRA